MLVIVWLVAALVATMTLMYTDLGFYLGHAFELLGLLLVVGAVAVDLHRGAQSRPLAGDFRAAALVTSEEAFLGAQVRALTARLAEKDEYTEEHTRRVAVRAVQVGEALNLSPRSLRTLAAGGLLHDIGKLAVPDGILRKPAPLTDDEYTCIGRTRRSGTSFSASWAVSPLQCDASSSTITSGSTGLGTRAGSTGGSSGSRRGFSPSVTCTTR